MTVLLLSVPRTGTNFAWAFLTSCGLHVALGERPLVVTGRDVLMYHTTEEPLAVKALGARPAIVPLRHPRAALASALDAGRVNGHAAVLVVVVSWWRALLARCAERPCVYLPVECADTAERARVLDRVASFAGARRREPFEWTPRNVSSGPIKTQYLQTGGLPLDASTLDFAVEWYEQQRFKST